MDFCLSVWRFSVFNSPLTAKKKARENKRKYSTIEHNPNKLFKSSYRYIDWKMDVRKRKRTKKKRIIILFFVFFFPHYARIWFGLIHKIKIKIENSIHIEKKSKKTNFEILRDFLALKRFNTISKLFFFLFLFSFFFFLS